MARTNADAARIQPFVDNPLYWQHQGRPVLLLGGSVEDNLFQIPELEAHLDDLVAAGGNYLRCTMSSRDPGNVWPWARVPETGQFDLDQWDPEYWHRFRRFLQLTADREIIIQIELWDPHDHYVRVWHEHPLNPRNNVNYTASESGLPETIEQNAWEKIQPLFETVPALKDLALVRGYQEAFIDRVLSFTLPFGHVLYCMDNETCSDPAWGAYWCEHVRRRAAEQGVGVETTEMWDNWDPTGGEVAGAIRQTGHDHPYLDRARAAETIEHPELYSFVDISNHNMQHGQTHYETARWVRRQVEQSDHPRPINCVKIYGAMGQYPFGDERQGLERFWRNIFAGLASSRFHRPPHGLGLSDVARRHLRSMRLLSEAMDLFAARPAPELLGDAPPNTAYCLAQPGRAYAVCFMDGGRAVLDVSAMEGPRVTLRWLDVAEARWHGSVCATAGAAMPLETPTAGFQCVLVEAET